MNIEKSGRLLSLWDASADYNKLVNDCIAPFDLKYTPEHDLVERFVAENLDSIAKSQNLFNQKYQSLFCSSELQNNPEFKIEDHNNIVNLIIYKSIYVYLFIRDHINDESWESEIINYIDYVTFSFGRLSNYNDYSIGLFDHINLLSKTIEDSDFNNERKTFILNYLSEIKERSEKEKDILDIIEIYNNWKKTISFDLSFFKRFKETFETGVILTTGNYKVNKYLELETFEMLPKEEVVEILYDFTTQIIEALHNDIGIYSKEDFVEFKDKEMVNFLLSKYKIDGLKLPSEINSEYNYTKAMRDWFANFNMLILELNSAINSSQIKSGHKPPVIYDAYKYVHYKKNSTLITDLYGFLKTKNFICQDTTKSQDFHDIFNDKIPKNKIIWTGGKSSLFYFIKKIHELGLVKKETDRYKWQIATKLFLLKDENGVLSEINPKIMKSMKDPVFTDKLDKAINLLKVWS